MDFTQICGQHEYHHVQGKSDTSTSQADHVTDHFEFIMNSFSVIM